MVDMDRVLQRNPECPVREIGEGLVIMAPDGSMTHSLDGIGAWIWGRLDGHASLEDVVAAMTAEYDVTTEQARADLAEFADQLLEAGLVTPA
jgi:hypothetical protein